MSGLEALGTAAAVVQLIDVSVRITKRLQDYNNNDLPKAFQEIKICLPAFTDILRHTKTAFEDDQLSEATSQVLEPLIRDCQKHIDFLNEKIDKILPIASDSGAVRAHKAWLSMRFQKDINKADATIQKYMRIMSDQAIAINRNSKKPVPAVPSGPSPAFVNKPFHRDGDFVDRAVMATITSQTCRPDPVARVALVGLGGTGKSQVAIEYAYRMRANAPETWVFWVDASSVAKVTEGYKEIAKAMRIPGWDKQDTDIFEIVYDWLCNEANGRWVMILDNVDDLDVLKAPSPYQIDPKLAAQQMARSDSRLRQIREYLPNSVAGSIVITSRARNIAFELTGNWNHCHQVEPMTEEEALDLLKKKLAGTHKDEDMIELVNALDCMPLAISQAAAYISHRHPLVTITTFIEDLKKEDQDTNEILEESAHESHRDLDRSNSVVATWHLSFQYVRRVRPSAASLLSLMSLFERQEILRPLLESNYGPVDRFAKHAPTPPASWWTYFMNLLGYSVPHDEEKETESPALDFIEDWAALNDLSLVKTTYQGTAFSMHRLVQLATSRWLQKNHEHEIWAMRFLGIMRIFPEAGRKEGGALKGYSCDVNLINTLYPHGRRALHYRPSDAEGSLAVKQWAILLFKAASYAEYRGFINDALLLSRPALEVFETYLGQKHEVTLRAAALMVEVLHGLGNVEECELLLRKTLKTRIRVSGELHEASIWLTKLLAQILRNQGRLREALALDEKAFENEVKGGSVIPGAPAVYTRLDHAETHAELGDVQKADTIIRTLFESVPQDVEEWGDYTTGEAGAMIHTAKKQGWWEMAESLLQRRIRYHDEILQDPDIYDILALGQVLAEQSKFDEAEQLYLEVGNISRQVFEVVGNCEPLLETLQCIASLLMKQGELAQAEEICLGVLQVKTKADGLFHANTMTAYFLLGEILEQQQRFQEALGIFKLAYVVTLERENDKRNYVPKYFREAEKYGIAYGNLKKKMKPEDYELIEGVGIGTDNEAIGAPAR